MCRTRLLLPVAFASALLAACTPRQSAAGVLNGLSAAGVATDQSHLATPSAVGGRRSLGEPRRSGGLMPAIERGERVGTRIALACRCAPERPLHGRPVLDSFLQQNTPSARRTQMKLLVIPVCTATSSPPPGVVLARRGIRVL